MRKDIHSASAVCRALAFAYSLALLVSEAIAQPPGAA
jgi:hypothetical protein